MDIDLLSKMVKELILDNDRVVLPGLGCFVAEIVPSTFSDKGYTINPPYRRLYFRTKPDQGDVLTRFYASTNNVEMEIADRIIIDFVAELKNVLFSKKTVIFPGLGRLRATKENNVFFVSDEDLDIYPAGFGLEPISLKTHQESPEEVAAAVEGLRQIFTEVEIPVSAPREPDPAIVEAIGMEDQEELQEQNGIVDQTGITEEINDTVKIKPRRRIFWAVFAPVLVAAVLFGAFVLISRINPELLDPVLYTPEELEILNYKSE